MTPYCLSKPFRSAFTSVYIWKTLGTAITTLQGTRVEVEETWQTARLLRPPHP